MNNNKINKKKRNLIIASIAISISIIIIIVDTNINKNSNENNSYNENVDDDDEYSQRGSVNNRETDDRKQIPTEYTQHLCDSSFEKISDFIVEYSIPFPCSQPVGIAIDNNDKAWIAATWAGYLLVFDPKINFQIS